MNLEKLHKMLDNLYGLQTAGFDPVLDKYIKILKEEIKKK